jgi:murein endopeptidase
MAPRQAAGPNAAGLVTLPCDQGVLRPVQPGYCWAKRNFVTPTGLAVVLGAAQAMAKRYPGFVTFYMDASWPSGVRPMPPHFSHGDGREVDLALAYDDLSGRPLAKPPTPSGYGAFIGSRKGDPLPCKGLFNPMRPDDPSQPTWRLDEARTRALVETVTADPRVKRVFLEPHLKLQLGLANDAKIHFEGCHAARHDDHLHVDIN